MKIYESKTEKLWGLITSLAMTFLGIVYLFLGSLLISFLFMVVGSFFVFKTINKLKRYPIVIELDDEYIRIPCKDEEIVLKWNNIYFAEIKFSYPKGGISSDYIVVHLKKGQIIDLFIPTLTISKEELVKIINKKAKAFDGKDE